MLDGTTCFLSHVEDITERVSVATLLLGLAPCSGSAMNKDEDRADVSHQHLTSLTDDVMRVSADIKPQVGIALGM